MTKGEILAKMRDSPLFMGKICVPRMFTIKSPAFHYELEEVYMNPMYDLVNTIAPRDHAKSSIVACLFVLHHLFMTAGPHVVVLVSRTRPHAVKLLGTIKNVLEFSGSFQAFFGYHGESSALKWGEDEIILDNGDAILTRGTGQQVVGLKVDNQRPTFIVLDDPEDTENTKTVESMEKNFRWLLTQLVPTRDSQRGRVFVIGTPQHQRCMVEILKTAPNWKTLWYSAEHDPMNKRSLWPEKFSWDRLQKMREAAGAIHRLSTYLREYCCTIVSDDEALFKQEDFRYYQGDIKWVRGHPYLHMVDKRVLPVNIFMGIDPAVSARETADYCVILPVAVDAQKNYYVLPYARGHWRPSEVIDQAKRMFKKWKPESVRMDVGGQQEIYADFLRKLEGGNVKIYSYRPREAKTKLYLEGLEPYFVRHKVWMQPDMTALKDELMSFRSDGRHAHDDMIDALFYAISKSYGPSHAKPVETGQSEEADAEKDDYMVA